MTCVFGVQGVPEHFASLLKNYSVRQVTLVMDGDRAGQKATQRLAAMFLEAGLDCGAVDLPDDSDPNRLLQERGPDGLLQVLKNRREIAGEAPVEPTTFQDGDQSFTATFGNTKYQLWPQAPFTTRLRARLRASRDHRMVMDVVDFYVGRSRKGILNQLIAQLELSRVDGERHLLTLMEHLEKWVASRREQEQEETSEAPTAPELSAAQKEEALHYLKQPRLVQRILNDMEELGYIGEENSKLLGYLISVSRKLEKPLSGVVLSQSGAGKSSLTELVEVMTPPEEVILFSRISPQALYWMPRDGVKRKLLILEERVGGEGADYSIRVLQSRQKLIQAVVIKDPATGKLMTKTFVVEGPIAYLETTTDLRINHENATRCFEIVLDESAEQTKRIHGWQRAQRLPSRQDRRRVQEKLRELHHNAQRLLEPVANNPINAVDPSGLQPNPPRSDAPWPLPPNSGLYDNTRSGPGSSIPTTMRGWSEALSNLKNWTKGNAIKRDYGPETVQVEQLRNSPGLQRARKYYLNKNRGKDCPEAVTDYDAKFGASEFLDATLGMNGTRHFVGTFSLDIYPVGNDRVYITVRSTTGRTSGLYQMGVSGVDVGWGRDQDQTYHWEEYLPTSP